MMTAHSKPTAGGARRMRPAPVLATAMLPSPVGALRLVASDTHLLEIAFPDRADATYAGAATRTDHPVLARTIAQLAEYFAGKRRDWDLPLAPRGTPFQRAVWTALEAIPYGETCSYADVARTIGAPAAVRAVGAANGRNPIPIILPCHRVIGTDGKLTGYGGGLDNKRWLLALEQRGGLRLSPT